MSGKSYFLSIALLVGLGLVYVGERIVDPGTSRYVATGLGVLIVLLAVGWRSARVSRATGDRRQIERWLLGLAFLSVLGLLAYGAQSDLPTRAFSFSLGQDWPKLAGVLAALWPITIAASLVPSLLMEMSYAAMARAPEVEGGRVRDAMFSGLGLVAVLVFAFSAMYVAVERDTKWDLSHFRATRPGEATQKIIQTLEEDLEVLVFYPPANDVGSSVRDYFDDLKAESAKLKVEYLDQALDPKKARDVGVSSNGAIVFKRGAKKETLYIGVELERARHQLRTLDAEVQKRLLTVARPKKVVYLTQGHGERLENAVGNDQRATVSLLHTELRAQNYEVKELTTAEGLAVAVPTDAAVVLVLGPTEAFSQPEANALKTYFEKGGRLMIAIDAEVGLEFKELVDPLGLTFTPMTLASDKAFFPVAYAPSDRGNIVTQTFSSHQSVTTLGRQGFPMGFVGPGKLEEKPQHPPELSVDFSVRSHPSTWIDTNNNFQLDPPAERVGSLPLVAAVTRRGGAGDKPEEQGRAIVLADSDALTDPIIRNRGNAFFAVEGLKWLLGDEAISGVTNTEVDEPIQRTRGQDMLITYGTSVLAPILVLAFGFINSRRRGRPAAPKKETTP